MKRILLSVFFFLFFMSVQAQDIAVLFENMPDLYIPQLESAWRKDLIDLYKSDKEARLQNTMGGFSILNELTSNYLLLQKTERSFLEMKLLPLVNNTYIICMVSTVDGPVSDSIVSFFTTDWEPLDAEDLFTPVMADWFIKDNIDKTNDDNLYALSRLDMDLIKYQLSPDQLTLTATYMTPQYLSKEEKEKVASFLKESPKVFNWEKYRFK